MNGLFGTGEENREKKEFTRSGKSRLYHITKYYLVTYKLCTFLTEYSALPWKEVMLLDVAEILGFVIRKLCSTSHPPMEPRETPFLTKPAQPCSVLDRLGLWASHPSLSLFPIHLDTCTSSSAR